jgi:hypothetical protein
MRGVRDSGARDAELERARLKVDANDDIALGFEHIRLRHAELAVVQREPWFPPLYVPAASAQRSEAPSERAPIGRAGFPEAGRRLRADGAVRLGANTRRMHTTPEHELSLAPIADVGDGLGLLPEELDPYGRFAAKIDLSALVDVTGSILRRR